MSFCKGNSHQRDPEKRLKPDSAKEIWYYISELQNPYVAGTTEIANSDVRKHSLTICVGRAEKSFLRLIWISFPFFVISGSSKRNFQMCLVVEEKGNTRVAQKLKTVRDASIWLLSYQRAWNGSSPLLTDPPNAPWEEIRGWNPRHRTPVCLNSCPFPGNYHPWTLG